MFTKFHNVSFIASTVTGLEIEGTTIHILTTGQSYEARFKTKAEAEAGLSELTDILNGMSNNPQEAPKPSKKDELKTAITLGFDRLQSTLEAAKTSATNKVQEAVMAQVFGTGGQVVADILGRKDDLVARATDMLSKLETLLDAKEDVKKEPAPMATRNEPKVAVKGSNEAVKRATSILDADGIFSSDKESPELSTGAKSTSDSKKITAAEFKKIFGTNAEPCVGDFSERQLREFIGVFVDGALANDRVQQLFQNIKDNFGVDEAEGAIEGYKALILTISLQNIDMTLSEIISRYFS